MNKHRLTGAAKPRRFPTLGEWATWYAIMVGTCVLVALREFGVWAVPDWLLVLAAVVVVVTSVPIFLPLRPSRRVSDARRTDGDARNADPLRCDCPRCEDDHPYL